MIRKRVAAAAICLLSIVVMAGWSEHDWPMAGRDSGHSGFIASGPRAPLKRAWLVQAWGAEGSFTTWPVVSENVVYALSGPGMLAVEAGTGKELWRREEPGEVTQVSPLVTPTGVLTFLPSGAVISVGKADGAELWRTNLDSAADMSSALAEGRAYIPAEKARALYSIDTGDGSVIWKSTLRGGPITVPAVSGGHVAVTTLDLETSTKELVVLNAADGSEVWKRSIGISHTSPMIIGERLIIGDEFFVRALDASTGEEQWSRRTTGQYEPWAIPAAFDGDVLIGDRLGHIYRLDGNDGKIKWTFDGVEGTFGQSSPVVAGDTLFAGTDAGELLALDARTGKLLWLGRERGAVLAGAADEKHFYFGVKFGEQGLYAYGHDPEGKLASAGRSDEGVARRSPVATVLGGVAVFGLVLLVVFLIGRRGKREAV